MKTKMIAGILLGALAAGESAGAQEQTVRIAEQKTGDITVRVITEGFQRGSPPRFVNADGALIKRLIPDGTVNAGVNTYVVETPQGVIVIDTGYGAGILEGLNVLGVKPGDVSAVLITHTHMDHIGGLVKNGAPVFPNAEVFLAARELDFWKKNRGDSILALLKKVTAFEPGELGKPGKPVVKGVTPYAAYGHTPGHTVYLVESGGKSLLIVGDLINVGEAQFPRPDIATAYDSDPSEASAARKRVLEYAAKNALPFSGMHLVSPSIGVVTQAGAGFAFEAVK
jgi:glyoxylase-like metal-dependent hydrolase (beta-lactamase superfamily II)